MENIMKVVILAGGLGTRISEESHLKPKPMIEIGGNPILWHIMKYYSYYGYNDFIICCGYKGYVIKEYFADYYQKTGVVHNILIDKDAIPKGDDHIVMGLIDYKDSVDGYDCDATYLMLVGE